LRKDIPDGFVIDLPVLLEQGRIDVVAVPVTLVVFAVVLDEPDARVVLV
jgi:hypothetical protein